MNRKPAIDFGVILLFVVLILAAVGIIWAAVELVTDFAQSIVEHGGFWEYMVYLFHNNLA